MAIKKPKRVNVGVELDSVLDDNKKNTIMSNQDRKRGDYKGSDKVRYSFMIPEFLLDQVRNYAQERGMSVTRVIIEGLNWRIKQD